MIEAFGRIGVAGAPTDATARVAGPKAPALRPLVVLLHDHVVQVRPPPRSPRVGLVAAASHGCIRLGPPAITWLARRIGGGVPLLIEASGR